MRKREKSIVIIFSTLMLMFSFTVISNKTKVEEILKNNSIISKFYEKNQKKRFERIFESKINNKKFKNILYGLSVDKMEIVDSILKDKKLVEFLNTDNFEKFTEIRDYKKALENSRIADEIKELSGLSPEIKRYFQTEFLGENYDEVLKKINDRPEVIRMRERIGKLLPIEGSKKTLKNLSEENLMEISEILSKSPVTVQYVEKKDLKNYSLEEIVEISKTLYAIGKINPQLESEIKNMTDGFDIRKAALYGDLYVKDKKYENEIMKEYEKGNYTFDTPYIKNNPYRRTPLSYGIMFKPDKEGEIVRVTILGMNGMPNYTYEKKYFSGDILPIVGLYPKSENTVNLEILDSKTKNVLRTKKLQLKTESVDNRLPVILVNKRNLSGMQSGFNLASYNLKDRGLPFAFDNKGNIRYILDTGKEMGKVRVEKTTLETLEVQNKEDKFEMDILGKILGRIGRDNVEEKLKNKKTKYLMKTNNILTVVSYRDTQYPYGLFSEYGLDSKEELFQAVIFYDKNSPDENIIDDGERVILYKGEAEN